MNIPNEMTAECDLERTGFSRAADEPWTSEQTVPYHVMLQNEIEALRNEVQTLRSQLLFPNNEPKFLGFPIRQYDASDDDCRRTTYEAYILGEWHEIVTCGLRWDKKEAFDSIVKILKRKAEL